MTLKQIDSPVVSEPVAKGENRRIIPPANPRLVRYLFDRWVPERPELLIRLRPRPQEVSHVAL